MIVPAAMDIESAADSLKNLPHWIHDDQLKELAAFGDARAKELGASGVSDDFKIGYLLALQTARVMIASSAELATKGADPNKVL